MDEWEDGYSTGINHGFDEGVEYVRKENARFISLFKAGELTEEEFFKRLRTG